MNASRPEPCVLQTTAGDFPLDEYRLRAGGREWSIRHTGAILSRDDEAIFLAERAERIPYGVALWPASVALAHEIAGRPEDFRGRTVLELGAGTGLPGLVAATCGETVVQTDRQDVALFVCRLNGERNGAPPIEYRRSDWTAWDVAGRFDWVIGSDILYGDPNHPHLRTIFTENLAPGGRVLVSDPFRANGLRLLEALESEGWTVAMNHWDVGEGPSARPVGVFELKPPQDLARVP